jgi:hypothetical protein
MTWSAWGCRTIIDYILTNKEPLYICIPTNCTQYIL